MIYLNSLYIPARIRRLEVVHETYGRSQNLLHQFREIWRVCEQFYKIILTVPSNVWKWKIMVQRWKFNHRWVWEYVFGGSMFLVTRCPSWCQPSELQIKIEAFKTSSFEFLPPYLLRILQNLNIIQTRMCLPYRECSTPSKCVFKCFANVSILKEEDLKPTDRTFQLLEPQTSHSKINSIR